jgi:GH15 family glucan-1,4-alpha-glucosidase
MVLKTTFAIGESSLELTDFFALCSPAGDRGGSRLVRMVKANAGAHRVEVELVPRFDYGEVEPWIRRHAPCLYSATGGDDGLVITSDSELETDRHSLGAAIELTEGEMFRLTIDSCPPAQIDESPLERATSDDIDACLEETLQRWASWSGSMRFEGEDADSVARSALTLKALSVIESGAIAAAATTSLPEGLEASGERNWDYRLSWVRDSSLAVRSLTRLGFEDAADEFRGFIERSAAGSARDLQVVFGLGGERRLGEIELDHLSGFRGARPVRVGNEAARQLQLDSFGLLVEQSWRWSELGHDVGDDYWPFLIDLVTAAAERWSERDAGFWEARSPRHFTHSKAMCWVAIDRGLKLAERENREVPVEAWQQAAAEIREAIDRDGVSEHGVFVRDFGSEDLDAALLRLPIVEYCDWKDERMLRTAEVVDERLGFDGLHRRYHADDGFDVEEGAFVACSFWLAECYARQDKLAEAEAVLARAKRTANDLGLFSEEYDPDRDEMLGNFPQGLSHLSHLEAALAIADCS